MALTIKQATWGDEAATTDVTKVLQDKASSGYMDLVADPSILPAISLDPPKTVALTVQDREEAKKFALDQCGGGQDDKCVAQRTASFEATLLQKRVAEQNSSKDIIKGRRLTVTFIDSNGVEKTIQVPDGQKLKIGSPPIAIKPNEVLDKIKTLAITILMTGLWVFSVVVTYRTFIAAGWVYSGYAATAVSVLIPYSGLLITPIGFMIINNYAKTDISKLDMGKIDLKVPGLPLPK
jgi:hypothetical protein